MDVLAAPDGLKDAMIRRWIAAVWESWADRHQRVRETTDALMTGTQAGDLRNYPPAPVLAFLRTRLRAGSPVPAFSGPRPYPGSIMTGSPGTLRTGES